jgi:hypothetical protein
MVGSWMWRHLQQSVNVWDCTLGRSPAVYMWYGRRCGEQVTNKNVFKHYHHSSDVKGQVLVCYTDNERIIFVFHRACYYIDPHYFFTKLTATGTYFLFQFYFPIFFILCLPYFIHLCPFIPLLFSLNLSCLLFFSLALQPSAGYGLLVHEVSWSHTTTRQSVGLL